MTMANDLVKFPADFLWGTSTSAHQVEGNNVNDWTEWEQHNNQRLASEALKRFGSLANWPSIKDQATNPANYISGQASAHYTKYPEDIALMKSLGLSAYRFSVEWSRFQPQPDVWDETALTHYKDVIAQLKQNHIEPVITLWHRTLPLWVEQQGGWENPQTIQHYLKFVEKVVTAYSNHVHFWIPLNEPEFEVLGSYLGGAFPPQVKNPWRAYKVFRNLIQAHNKASTIIHQLQPTAQVGTAQAAIGADPYKNRWLNRIATKILNYLSSWKFLNAVKDHSDFFGIQYYTRPTINIGFKGNNNFGIPLVGQVDLGLPKSDMGWEINPGGIRTVITENWQRYHKPIYITENGLPDSADTYRTQFIQDILANVYQAQAAGAEVRGYFHWSLLDNFEWDKGFWPKFGLIEIVPQTLERKIRPSAYAYRDIIVHGIKL